MTTEFFCRNPTNKSYDGHYAANSYHDNPTPQKDTYLEKVTDLPGGAIYREIPDSFSGGVIHQNNVPPPPSRKHNGWNWVLFIIGLGLIGLFGWWLFNKDKSKNNNNNDKNKGKIILAVDSTSTNNNTNGLLRGNMNEIFRRRINQGDNNANTNANVNDNSDGNGVITKAVATLDHIQALPNNPSKNWVTISNGPSKINLLDLKNASPHVPQIITETSIPIGLYQKLKFHINKIEVDDSLGGKTVWPAGHNVEFDLPFKIDQDQSKNGSGKNDSNTANNSKNNGGGFLGLGGGGKSNKNGKIDGSIDNTTVIILDIPLDLSLRDAVDENNRPVRVFIPTINYEARGDAQVATANKKLVWTKPGILLSQGKVGMDINGNVEKDYLIPPNSPLRVEKGKIYLIHSGPFPPLPPFPVPNPVPVPGPGPNPVPVVPIPNPPPMPGPPGPQPNINPNGNGSNLSNLYPPDWVQPQLTPAANLHLQQQLIPTPAPAPFFPSPALLPGNRYNRQ
jgi:hypothetical protein